MTAPPAFTHLRDGGAIHAIMNTHGWIVRYSAALDTGIIAGLTTE